jgi:phosphatidyl-myo-inositol alpha-mannosyltransferase
MVSPNRQPDVKADIARYEDSAVPLLPARRQPMRICMMVTYDLAAPCGGVKHHAQQLASALRRRGDEVTIVGPASAPVKDEHTHTFRGVVNIPANGSDNELGIFVRPWQVAKYFRQNKFDVIHVHEPAQPSLSYWSVWATRKLPHVATFHAYAEQESRGFTFARRFWGMTLFPFFQRAIAVSEPAARYASMVWKRPLTVIPNGVPTEIFTPAPTKLHEKAAPLRLLFVGRIGDKRKGARYMFEAYQSLIERGVNVTLDVAGELGQAEPPPALPGLTYHGAVNFDRLVQLYRECDLFVAPSTGQESFGIVLLEAMSAAKPVVCSDIDGYRQVAIPDGSYLVPPSNAGALADQIAAVVKLDPATRRRQGEINRKAALGYDWERLADRVRDEYCAAIEERALGRAERRQAARAARVSTT